MEKYDYNEAVLTDVKDWMNDEIEYIREAGCKDREELEEWLHDTLWTTDSVTGNGSGSYTFNAWEAEKNFAIISTYSARLLQNLAVISHTLKSKAQRLAMSQ